MMWWLALAFAGDNLFGGRVVENPQLYLHAGYPTTEIGVHVPAAKSFDVTPWARFRFAEGTSVGQLGSGAGVDFRIQLLKDKKLQGSLWFSVGGEVMFPGGYVWGDVILGHPGWLMTWAATDELDLDFGVRFEADLLANADFVSFRAAVPLFVGVGFEVADGIQLGFRAEGGPAFIDGNLYPDVSALFFVGWSL